MTSRSRSRSEGPITARQTRYVNGLETHNLDTVMKSVTETMDDVVTPNFHSRSARGEVINSPCSIVKDTISSTGGGIFDVTQSGIRYEARGEGCLTTFLAHLLGHPDGYFIAPATAPSHLLDAVKLQALGNVDRSPYSFGEDIGELGETLRFLRRPFHSVNELARKLTSGARSKQGSSGLSYAKALADVYAEYQWAFLPLVRSIHDAIAAFSDEVRLPSRRTARGSDEFFQRDVGNSGGAYSFDAETSVFEEHRAGILYEHTNPLNDWRFKYGLRFKDIPETMWQLFPLSFMVDRAYNISASLRGLLSFLDPNIKILAAWTSNRSTTIQSRRFVDYDYTAGVSAKNIQSDTETRTSYSYDRGVWEPSTADLIPPLDLGNVVDSATKIADLAAIFFQRVR